MCFSRAPPIIAIRIDHQSVGRRYLRDDPCSLYPPTPAKLRPLLYRHSFPPTSSYISLDHYSNVPRLAQTPRILIGSLPARTITATISATGFWKSSSALVFSLCPSIITTHPHLRVFLDWPFAATVPYVTLWLVLFALNFSKVHWKWLFYDVPPR